MEFAADESGRGNREIYRRQKTREIGSEPARHQGCELTAASAGGSAPSSASLPPIVTAHNCGELVTANAGDHKLIHALLRAVHQAPSFEDFVSWLDEPSYEPLDRLLVKQSGRIVAHVQLLDRLAWFDGIKLPVGGIQDLVALPEYRDAGYERLLLQKAEKTLLDRQAIVAFARTDRPELFCAHGWSEVLDARSTEANVADILASVSSLEADGGRRARSPRIRLWRHVELDALRRVYHRTAQASWGAIDRSEPYWRWLVGRKVHDELIVAVHGRDHWDDLEKPVNIVGYTVMRGSQVVELCCLPSFAHVGSRLLARACQDAIEQDHRTLSLRIPASNPLHELMIASGGHWYRERRANGGTLMVKLLDPPRWIESIYPLLQSRTRAAGIPRPYSVTFRAGSRQLLLELTRRSGRLTPVESGPVDAHCSEEAFAALMVGNLQLDSARDAGQFEIPNEATAEQLASLFPANAVWQSPFDSLSV